MIVPLAWLTPFMYDSFAAVASDQSEEMEAQALESMATAVEQNLQRAMVRMRIDAIHSQPQSSFMQSTHGCCIPQRPVVPRPRCHTCPLRILQPVRLSPPLLCFSLLAPLSAYACRLAPPLLHLHYLHSPPARLLPPLAYFPCSPSSPVRPLTC